MLVADVSNNDKMSAADRLRELLASPGVLPMPCCFDAFSSQLVERAGFALTFMSGFATSVSAIGEPDVGLISYGEMVARGAAICASVSIPVLGDADTGYGNAMNVKRTIRGYEQAGFACAMIEDQVAPKRCGHTRGKQVVERDEAFRRVRAAVDARDEGADILIMARTDARQTLGFDEALARAVRFAELGADIVFLEAPETVEEMRIACGAIDAPTMANMLHGGVTPILSPPELEAIGYKIVAYPLTLLNAAAKAMQDALAALRLGHAPDGLLSFDELKSLVGFDEYYEAEKRYS